ncbi:hypothetical protein [Pantoea ananatis]|uniref:hypothetical protein n=1 Tax=Pantoea ananas TaxID=553 RepID=UPI0004902BF9|nr:hypothetical protein [Pantoea ananatis]
MASLTTADVNADLDMLTNTFSSGKRIIPSNTDLLKACFYVPAISVLLSLLSTFSIFCFEFAKEMSLSHYWDFLMTDGWAVILPTAIIGLFFAFMAYNNLIMYMTIPAEVRVKSLILSHLKRVVQKTVFLFLTCMFISSVTAGFVPWFAFGVPALEFALLFVINIVIGSEVNRLGAGVALEKVSALLKKI